MLENLVFRYKYNSNFLVYVHVKKWVFLFKIKDI